jgi:hypothetical protein
VIALPELAPARPPCSQAERAGAESLQDSLGRVGLAGRIESLRAPTSPAWVPLLRALLRVWAVALVAAYRPVPAIVLAALAVASGFPSLSALIRYLPLLGNETQNVVASVEGTQSNAKPLIAVAHVDTHPLATAPMSKARSALAAAFGWGTLAAAVVGRPDMTVWRVVLTLFAVESLFTLAWLARRELSVTSEMPDDNTSGLLALVSLAMLLNDHRPLRNVWIVGSGAGTSGGHGLVEFLRRNKDLRESWVVEIDTLGAGEVVASPLTPRFPGPGTPPSLIRALVAASRQTGDPLSVRRIRRAHSDARAALRLRTGAITLTAGLSHPAGQRGPDPANAERAARVVDRLARSED